MPAGSSSAQQWTDAVLAVCGGAFISLALLHLGGIQGLSENLTRSYHRGPRSSYEGTHVCARRSARRPTEGWGDWPVMTPAQRSQHTLTRATVGISASFAPSESGHCCTTAASCVPDCKLARRCQQSAHEEQTSQPHSRTRARSDRMGPRRTTALPGEAIRGRVRSGAGMRAEGVCSAGCRGQGVVAGSSPSRPFC